MPVYPGAFQKHDYPSAGWRISYARRTAAERANASIKDPAAGSIDQGWIRQTGLTRKRRRELAGAPAGPP